MINLHDLDTIRPTPLDEEIERRRSDPLPLRQIPDPNGAGRRLTAGVVAFAIFAVAMGVGLISIADRTSAPGAWNGYASGWTQLPAPPVQRTGATLVWTGSELLSWGGVEPGRRGGSVDGFSFDPSDGQWQAMPAAPWAARRAIGMWTGSEALFFIRDEHRVLHPLAFDPTSGAWRRFPAAPGPIEKGTRVSLVWTGQEALLQGGGPGEMGISAGYTWWALRPAAGVWAHVPMSDLDLSGAMSTWTGTQLLAVPEHPEMRTTARHPYAQLYTPATQEWLVIGAPPVDRRLNLDVVGGRTIAWNGSGTAQWFDTGEWIRRDRTPLQQRGPLVAGAVVGDLLFTWNGGAPAVWSADTSEWTSVAPPAPSSSEVVFGTQTAAGDGVVVDAGQALWLWKPPVG